MLAFHSLLTQRNAVASLPCGNDVALLFFYSLLAFPPHTLATPSRWAAATVALAADRQPTPEAGDPRLNNSNNTVLGGLGLPSRCACVCVSSTQHLSTFAHVRVFLFWTGPCDTHVYMSRDIGRQWRGLRGWRPQGGRWPALGRSSRSRTNLAERIVGYPRRCKSRA